MLVSTKGRYALRALVDLAVHTSKGRQPLKVIAERQGISEKYLEGVLTPLARADILDGVRGRGGGYQLTRNASDITAGEILRLTEGSLAPVPCLEAEYSRCEHAQQCPTLGMWTKLDDLINTYLDSVTIDDLAKGVVDPKNNFVE